MLKSSSETDKVKPVFSTSSKFHKSVKALEGLIGKVYKKRYKIKVLDYADQLSASFICDDLQQDCEVVLRAPRYFQPEVISSFTAEIDRLAYITKAEEEHTLKLLDKFEPFYVEEMASCSTLEQSIAKGDKFTEVGTLEILLEVCQSLIKAHNISLIHGRLTPKIIYVEKKGTKFVARVGGYCFAEPQVLLAKHDLVSKKSPYSNEGIFQNKFSDYQDDIYSLAVIGYQLLSGRLPSLATDQKSAEKQYQSLSDQCPKLKKVEMFDEAFCKAFWIDVDSGYANVADFANDLTDIYKSLTEVSEEKEASPINEESLGEKDVQESDVVDFTADVPDADEIEKKLQKLKFAVEDKRSEDELLAKDFSSDHFEDEQKPRERKRISLDDFDYTIHDHVDEELIDEPEADVVYNPQVGDIILENFVLLEYLSEKENISVFLAKDLKIDRMVAIKTLNDMRPDIVSKFSNEVELIAKLQHDNFVQFLGFEKVDGRPFYIMEYVDAPTLNQLLEQIETLETEEQIATATIQLCDALDYLHENGLYHGNISADNLIVLEDAGGVTVKICGLGTAVMNEYLIRENKSFNRALFKNTGQWHSMNNSREKDIYAATAVVYQMTTGHLPYDFDMDENDEDSDKEQDTNSIARLRSDIFGVNKLDKLLKRGFSVDSLSFFESIKELKSGIKEWIDQAYDEFDLSDDDGSEKEEIKSNLLEGEGKTLEQLQEEIRQSQVLKANQSTVENSFSVKFASKAGIFGRRKSPVRTILEMVAVVLGSGLIIYGIAYYGINNFDKINNLYWTASRKVGAIVYGNKSGSSLEGTKEIAFRYEEDPVYKRWTDAKVVGEKRRILPNGRIESKR